jgi:5,10-methylenetetrahydrofolate reductase
MVVNMRDKSMFQCGEVIKEAAPKFLVGAAENPFGDPFEFRPYRLGKKIKAGVDFIQTQCIFNVPRFKEFMQRCGDLGLLDKVYILAGVTPVKGPAGAKYMRDSVPGMDVPNEVVERLEAAGKGIEDKKARAEANKKVGIEICVETIQQVREIPGVAGIHIMAVEWEEAVKTIVEKAGLLPRPIIKVEESPVAQAA